MNQLRLCQIITYTSIASSIFLLDQYSKHLALAYLTQAPYKIAPYIFLELTINRGVAWSIFHDASYTLLAIVQAVRILLLVFLGWHAFKEAQMRRSIVGEVLIAAGACSNMLDRIFYFGVIDFIHIFYKNYSWPIFNIADSAIVIGAVYILAKTWLSPVDTLQTTGNL